MGACAHRRARGCIASAMHRNQSRGMSGASQIHARTHTRVHARKCARASTRTHPHPRTCTTRPPSQQGVQQEAALRPAHPSFNSLCSRLLSHGHCRFISSQQCCPPPHPQQPSAAIPCGSALRGKGAAGPHSSSQRALRALRSPPGGLQPPHMTHKRGEGAAHRVCVGAWRTGATRALRLSVRVLRTAHAGACVAAAAAASP